MPKFPAKGGDGGGGKRGGDNHPVLPRKIIESRCHVCQSPFRDEIDKALLRGFSQANICRHFQSLGAEFNRKNLSSHARKHLTLGQAAMRSLIEDEARKQAINVEEAKESLVTKYAALKAMLYRGFEDVMSGASRVEPRDLIVVVEKLEQLEAEQEKVAVDEMIAQFNSFVQAVKEHVSEEEWQVMYKRYQEIDDMRKGMGLEQLVTLETTAEEPKLIDPPEDVDDDDDEGLTTT